MDHKFSEIPQDATFFTLSFSVEPRYVSLNQFFSW